MFFEELDQIYETAISSDSKHFFIELKNYANYINDSLEFKDIISDLNEQKKYDQEQLKDISDKIFSFSKEFYKSVSRKRKKDAGLSDLLDQIKSILDGRTLSSLSSEEELIFKIRSILNGQNKTSKKLKEFVQSIDKLALEYKESKNKFLKRKDTSIWYPFSEISLLYNIDEYNNNNFPYSMYDPKQYVKTIITRILSGEKDDSFEEKFRLHLKKLHTYFRKNQKKLKISYVADFKYRHSIYANRSDKDFLSSVVSFIVSFRKEILIFMLLLLLFSLSTVFNLLKILFFGDLSNSFSKLQIPISNFPYLFSVTIGYFFAVFIIYLIKKYSIELNNGQEVELFNRFFNGYFILAVFLCLITLLASFNILSSIYGSTLPRENTFLDIENFNATDGFELSKVTCYGNELEKDYFLTNVGAVCDFDIRFKNTSKYYLKFITVCIDINRKPMDCASYSPDRDRTKQHVPIATNLTGKFEAYVFLDLSNITLDKQNRSIRAKMFLYRDISRSLNEHEDLENQKNTIFFATIPIILFSIFSTMVSIKELTKKEK